MRDFSFIDNQGRNIEDDDISYMIQKRPNPERIVLVEREWRFQGDSPNYHIVCSLTKEETRYLISKNCTVFVNDEEGFLQSLK
jgi:hypothetical protein